jgi:hypothetical protein
VEKFPCQSTLLIPNGRTCSLNHGKSKSRREMLEPARMFIADVDRRPTEAGEPRAGILQTLFGRSRKPAETEIGKDLHASSVLQRVVEVVVRDSDGLAFVYETAGGLRIILAHREIDPCSEEGSANSRFHRERSALSSSLSQSKVVSRQIDAKALAVWSSRSH